MRRLLDLLGTKLWLRSTLVGIWLLACLTVAVSVESLGWLVLLSLIPTVFIYLKGRFSVVEVEAPNAGQSADEAKPVQSISITPTQLSILIYSIVASLIIIGVRRIRGLGTVEPMQDWSVSDLPPALLESARLGHDYFNKLHIRNGLLEILILTVCLVLILQATGWFLKRTWFRDGSVSLSPATAIFSLVLLFSVVKLPPYKVDPVHWASFVTLALDASAGAWPYFHTIAGYGFLLGPVLLGIFRLFGLSSLAIGVTTIIATAIAGGAAYILVSQVAHSKSVGLLAAAVLLIGFYNLEYAVAAATPGALRFQLMTSLSLLLAWIILTQTGRAALLGGIALGVLALWNPSHQVFILLPLVGGLAYQYFFARKESALRGFIGIATGGLAPLLIIIVAFSQPIPWLEMPGIIERGTVANQIFLSGFGGIAQNIKWPEVIWLVFGLLGGYLLLLKLQRGALLTSEELFLACNLVYAIPVLLYHLSRTSSHSADAVAWVMLPEVILIIALSLRERDRLSSYAAITGLVLSFIISQGVITRFADSAQELLLPYEHEREQWASACLDQLYADQPCDRGTWPGLREMIATSSAPLIDITNDETNYFLAQACAENTPVYSMVGPLIYWYGGCELHQNITIMQIASISSLLEDILQSDEIVVDRREFAPPPSLFAPFITRIETFLLDNGYCGEFSEQTASFFKECSPRDPIARFNDSVLLHDWSLYDSVEVQGCQIISVSSTWSAGRVLEPNISLSLVLADQNGQGVARTDTPPLGLPTDQWRIGSYYHDRRQLSIPCDIAPGEYYLMYTVYYSEDANVQPMAVSLLDGTPMGDSLYLTTLKVR